MPAAAVAWLSCATWAADHFIIILIFVAAAEAITCADEFTAALRPCATANPRGVRCYATVALLCLDATNVDCIQPVALEAQVLGVLLLRGWLWLAWLLLLHTAEVHANDLSLRMNETHTREERQ
jgi:hypothetical protein